MVFGTYSEKKFPVFRFLKGFRLSQTVFQVLSVTSEFFQSCGNSESFINVRAKDLWLSWHCAAFFERVLFGKMVSLSLQKVFAFKKAFCE